jgi:phosphoribosylanthranilate isomerase
VKQAMSSVKICGLQQPEMVQAILHLPIDYIGFVFAKSKRQVTSQQAGKMLQVIQERRDAGLQAPLAVGVFVNPSEAELKSVMQHARLDVVQLHGQESPEQCQWVKDAFPGVQVWKVISVAQGHRLEEETASSTSGSLSLEADDDSSRAAALLEPYRTAADGILLDTFDPVYGGGSGKTFDWEAITAYQAWCREAGLLLLVAGGLLPGNVGDLLDAYAPDGVDVSSGVETDGVKDIDKIIRFVERVKHRD